MQKRNDKKSEANLQKFVVEASSTAMRSHQEEQLKRDLKRHAKMCGSVSDSHLGDKEENPEDR